MMSMPDQPQSHLVTLPGRLDWLQGQPDGILLDVASPLHHIRILKQAGQVQFYFVDSDGKLEGPMSRMAIDRPLRLLAEYTQAAMCALLWRPAPQRACLLGLAGGRLSLVLYHAFPDLVVDNVDIDPAVGSIAATYFGLTFDDRQTLAIRDARAFLRELPPGTAYDIIVMDAFRDDSDDLPHLATAGFYAECKAHLARGGVVCANVLMSDRLFLEKLKTFLHSFRHVYASEHKHGLVLLGNDLTRLAESDIRKRAEAIQRRREFDFAFVERAAGLRPARELTSFSARALREVRVLRDSE
jgi:spermidine synthase